MLPNFEEFCAAVEQPWATHYVAYANGELPSVSSVVNTPDEDLRQVPAQSADALGARHSEPMISIQYHCARAQMTGVTLAVLELRAKAIEEGCVPTDIVLVIDTSASMDRVIPVFKLAIEKFANRQQTDSRLAIVLFSTSARAVLGFTVLCSDNVRIFEKAVSCLSGNTGSPIDTATNVSAGIALAIQLLDARCKQTKQRTGLIFLASDGLNTVAQSTLVYPRLALTAHERGYCMHTFVPACVVTFRDYNMVKLAEMTGGHLHRFSDATELADMWCEEVESARHAVGSDICIDLQVFRPLQWLFVYGGILNHSDSAQMLADQLEKFFTEKRKKALDTAENALYFSGYMEIVQNVREFEVFLEGRGMRPISARAARQVLGKTDADAGSAESTTAHSRTRAAMLTISATHDWGQEDATTDDDAKRARKSSAVSSDGGRMITLGHDRKSTKDSSSSLLEGISVLTKFDEECSGSRRETEEDEGIIYVCASEQLPRSINSLARD
ncbi:hypothetical protein M427DRAFT_48503 [Gonapodya prolifera JEL478]|uniref:VWFA domain-containing protein n=1 Tax=Gonapodya prolifera (strain JEL478) TaxID=1344416 RepID=A0A139A1H5_GONPJ|nr:hypothetical protein M427DRAFT_48503 [Gonapodya prolifera JEL478]|eukprot:KXS10213.1 hypothetical protein M427DRAFT_48503 [Gonapodya prolifera JEL478]